MNAPVSDSTQRYLDAWQQLGARDDALATTREAAIKRFGAQGFPHKKIEEWKYTTLRRLERRTFSYAASHNPDAINAASLPLAEAGLPTLAFINGRYSEALSRTGHLASGVHVSSIAQDLAADDAALKTHLDASLDANASQVDALATLNAAFITDGARVRIDANTHSDAPLHLLFISQQTDDAVVTHPRVIIHAGRGSEVSIVEHYISIDEAANFTNAVTEFVLDDNAVVRHYRITDESNKTFHISNTRVHQSRDSQYLALNLDVGGLLVRHDVHTHMDGEGAHAQLDGLFVLNGSEHCDNHTYVHHTTPHTSSRERYKGILDGRSRGIYNGMVYVAKDAQKIDSKQSSHNLLLSEKAEIDTKPELEIYADDVRCDHGATVGQLDETALFYLQSRGINARDARHLLIIGFARELTDVIKHDAVRDYFENALVSKLQDVIE